MMEEDHHCTTYPSISLNFFQPFYWGAMGMVGEDRDDADEKVEGRREKRNETVKGRRRMNFGTLHYLLSPGHLRVRVIKDPLIQRGLALGILY